MENFFNNGSMTMNCHILNVDGILGKLGDEGRRSLGTEKYVDLC